ncbi:immunity protein Imm33 domain-containing protein [Micromonospora psammae]|uniref:immunity protein Imm33 domain-containing protein n=1 Tax=Micromonospora sp. CPCC 205556 TaxID=3122398 RepID=UPI003FA598F3
MAGSSNGWFVWRGHAIPQDDDKFFAPLHVEHLNEHAPELGPYLALPPGWGVVLAPGYEDVWYDEISSTSDLGAGHTSPADRSALADHVMHHPIQIRNPLTGARQSRLRAYCSKFLYVFKAALDGPHAPPPGRASDAGE